MLIDVKDSKGCGLVISFALILGSHLVLAEDHTLGDCSDIAAHISAPILTHSAFSTARVTGSGFRSIQIPAPSTIISAASSVFVSTQF